MQKKIVISLCLFFLTGCFQREKPEIPQEGDIVTWKQNDHLVVKAKLGPRRIHIPDIYCKRCEAEFYQPEHEHYLGQFPINYVPEKFNKISVLEAQALPYPYAINQLEFNLALNGSIIQATDESIHGEDGLDHPDQVKVMVFNRKNDGKRTSDVIMVREKSYSKEFNVLASKKYGMKCWNSQETNFLKCYGQSKYKKSVGIIFTRMGGNANWVYAQSWEPLYGGVEIKWRMDINNLHHWKEIDSAIWRLLDTWNVSPISDSSQ